MNIGVYWTLISPAYLNIGMKSSQSTCSWKVFLTKLGVQERLAVERVDVDLQEQVQSRIPVNELDYVHFHRETVTGEMYRNGEDLPTASTLFETIAVKSLTKLSSQ